MNTPYPEHTPPAPPEGMKWEYRGMGWNTHNITKFYVCPKVHFVASRGDYTVPLGHDDTHYFEAVPDPARLIGCLKGDKPLDFEREPDRWSTEAPFTEEELTKGYVRNDPKGAAGALKPQLQLIPTVAMQEEAKALDDGRNKYGQDNWRSNKVCVSTYIGAILRHTLAYRDGEDVDPESKSGVHHLGSVRACCAILLDALKHGTLVDDRPSTNHDTTV